MGGSVPAASRPTAGFVPASARGARAQLRAVAIALALLVQCTSATPHAPLTAEHLARPEGARTLQRLETALVLLGTPVSRERIAAALIEWSERGVRVRSAFLAPFLPLARVANLDQRWTLFTGTVPETFRLHVDGRRRDGVYVPLYRAGPSAGGADEALSRRLQYRRIRGLYNPSVRRGARPAYPGVARWLSRALLAQRPELDTVRVRMERLRVGEPGTLPTHLGFEHTLLERRGQTP
jgi:hypothetical protein